MALWLFRAANPQAGNPFCIASAIETSTAAQAQCEVQVHAVGCLPCMGTYMS